MKLLYQHLTDYLLTFLPESYQANFYSWIDDGRIINEGKQETEKGEILFYLEYKAELLFNELPFRKLNPLHLMALIKDWLDQYDSESYRLDQFEIPFDLDQLDDDLVSLAFSIQLREPVYAQQDPSGELQLLQKRYQIRPLEVNVAEGVEVYAHNEQAG